MELILLNFTLADLLNARQIYKAWKDTISGSLKLKIVLGQHSSTGCIEKNTNLMELLGAQVSKNELFIDDLPLISGLEAKEELIPIKQYLSNSALEYLSYARALAGEGHVACSAYLTTAFPAVFRRYRARAHHRPNEEGLHFCLSHGIPRWAHQTDQTSLFTNDVMISSLSKMYATQPPVSCLVLETTNDYFANLFFRVLSERVQENVEKEILIINKSGVTIGDVKMAADTAWKKFSDTMRQLESDYWSVVDEEYWEAFKEMRRRNRQVFKECIYGTKDDEEDKDTSITTGAIADDDEWAGVEERKMERAGIPTHDEHYIKADLFGSLYFKLSVPKNQHIMVLPSAVSVAQ